LNDLAIDLCEVESMCSRKGARAAKESMKQRGLSFLCIFAPLREILLKLHHYLLWR